MKKLELLKIFKRSSHQAIDYDVYNLSPIEILRYLAEGVLIDAIISYIFYRNIIAFLILLPAVFCYPILKKNQIIKTRKKRLEVEFKEGILILASLLSAGYSAENALKECVEELVLICGETSLISKEFSYLSHLVYMNIPIEKAFEDFGERSKIDDIRNFARVLKIAKRSGGELISIINHTSGVINDKIRIKEEILTLTAAKRFEQKIMNLFPFAIVLYIDTSSPGFFRVMYSTIPGVVMMSVCLIGYVFAIYMTSKILSIEV